MRIRYLLVLPILVGSFLSPFSRSARAQATLELYGTFHSMGIIVTVAPTDDPDHDAVANVMYQISGSDSYRQGFPLSRISDTRFVGSLFWLEPGTSYDVRVTFADSHGDPLNGVMLEATAPTRIEITIPAPSHSFYVSSTGSGTVCALDVPCSLLEGLNQAQPGEEVVLRGGVYYQGEINLPRSGVAGAPITIRGYPGETPILDGADPASFSWTEQGGGVWSTSVNVVNTHLVVANGERLYPYQSLTDLQTLIWGIPGFYASGTTVYVHLTGDADPTTASVIVSRKNYALWIQQNFIYLLNLTFRHYGQGDSPRAVYLRSGSDNLVQGCTFAVNDTGIVLKEDADRNVIQGNEFYDTIFLWPWDSLYAGSGLTGKGGIWFWGPNTGSSSIPRGTIIRRNTFRGFFDGFRACHSRDIWSGMTNETDVYENLVYDAGDDGMEADGECSNVRIWRNTFHDVLVGVSLAPARIGPVYAIRNLIYRTGISGYGGATAFKFQNDNPGSGPMFLFHNTVAAPVPGGRGIYLTESAIWPLLVARNNVWTGNDGYAFSYKVDDPVDLDYDDLWRTTSWPLVTWRGTQYQTLTALCAATGQECHGLSVSPGFVNEASGDYTPDSTSQLIDAGIYIPGINGNYAGNAPDIGAFEHESYGFSLNALPPIRVIAPGGTTRYIIDTQPTGGFASTVSLAVGSPQPGLTLQLSPTILAPPAHATLSITDTHSGSSLLPGLWYTIRITATGGGVTQETAVGLLVGGSRTYLPEVVENYAQ